MLDLQRGPANAVLRRPRNFTSNPATPSRTRTNLHLNSTACWDATRQEDQTQGQSCSQAIRRSINQGFIVRTSHFAASTSHLCISIFLILQTTSLGDTRCDDKANPAAGYTAGRLGPVVGTNYVPNQSISLRQPALCFHSSGSSHVFTTLCTRWAVRPAS